MPAPLPSPLPAVAHGRYVLVATATPEQAPAADARGAAARVPLVEATTFHLVGCRPRLAGGWAGRVSRPAWRLCTSEALRLPTGFTQPGALHATLGLVGAGAQPTPADVHFAGGLPTRASVQVELEGGCVADSWTLAGDYVELRRNQGVHLRGSLLLVLGVSALLGGAEEPGEALHRQAACGQQAGHRRVALFASPDAALSACPALPPAPAAAAGQPDAAHAAAAARGAPAAPAEHRAALPGGCNGAMVVCLSWQARLLSGWCWCVLEPCMHRWTLRQLPPAGCHLPAAAPSCPPLLPAHAPWPYPTRQDDDALVLAQLEEAERRLQRQRRQRAAQRCPSGALLPSGSAASLAAAAASGPAPPAAARAAGRAAADAAQPGSDSEAEASAGRPAGAGAEWAGGQDAVGGGAPSAPSPILGGLKQCLLAYLFREAQRESQEAAAAAAACSTAAPSQPPGGLAGIGGSSSLPNLQAAGSAPLLARLGSRFGSSSSLLGQGLAQGGGGDGGGVGAAAAAAAQAARAAAWRRPLDRFCFYFEAHAELLMWRVRAAAALASPPVPLMHLPWIGPALPPLQACRS